MHTIDIELVRESIRRLALIEIPKFQLETNYNTVPRLLFERLCQSGFGTPSISEEYGGAALGPLATAIIFEELAHVDAGVSIFMSVHSMVAGLLFKFASSELKAEILPDLVNGKKLAAFALTEPSAGSDAAALKTKAEKNTNGFILNGEKCYITSAGFADVYLVFAKTRPESGKNGISAFLIDAKTKGLEISPPEKKMGAELSPIASLKFNDLFIPAKYLVGNLDQGYKVALGGLAGGRVNIAAVALGISQSAFKKARSYIVDRQQFGQAVSEFQGIQFMLADMYTKLQAARLLTYQAASDLETNNSHTRLNSSIAKCYATDAAMQITTDAVQLLGGAGYIKEYGVESLMRAAKMLQIVEGTNQIQRQVIARELFKL